MADKEKRTPKGQETRAITEAEYREIIETMRAGKPGLFAPNKRAAMALMLEANLGIRISDIVKLRLCDIVPHGNTWRLCIIEQKTRKERYFKVPPSIKLLITEYCYQNGIKENEPIVQIKRRSVQDALKKVTNFLELERVGTHSFRKYFATRIYESSGNDIELVRVLLQHDNTNTTRHYIRVTPERVDAALEDNVVIV